MTPIKSEWRKFVNEMNKSGDKIQAYMKAFPNCKSRKVAATSAERLLKRSVIYNLIKLNPSIQQEARGVAINELKNEIKIDVLDATLKRSLLKQIVTGEMTIEEHFIKRDGTVGKYFRKPNVIEILKAIEVDNRMAGDDAPEKHEYRVTDISSIYKKAMQLKVSYNKTIKI